MLFLMRVSRVVCEGSTQCLKACQQVTWLQWTEAKTWPISCDGQAVPEFHYSLRWNPFMQAHFFPLARENHVG